MRYVSPVVVVTIDAQGGAIPRWNNVALGIRMQSTNANGILTAKAENIAFAAAKIVLPQPNKNPFIQNTNGTIK